MNVHSRIGTGYLIDVDSVSGANAMAVWIILNRRSWVLGVISSPSPVPLTALFLGTFLDNPGHVKTTELL